MAKELNARILLAEIARQSADLDLRFTVYMVLCWVGFSSDTANTTAQQIADVATGDGWVGESETILAVLPPIPQHDPGNAFRAAVAEYKKAR